MPKVDRLGSQKIDIMPYPNVSVNCTVQLERLHPYKFIQDTRERNKQKNQWYRDEINSGFNLLMKWVPGTTKSSRPDILKKTVNYIQKLQEKEIERAEKTRKYIEELEQRLPVKKRVIKELEHRIKELENTQTALSHRSFTQENYIKELEHKDNYIKELEQKIKELETWQTPGTYPSEPHLDLNVRTTSEAKEELPEEKLLPKEELLASGECTKLLPAEEELIADFNLELLVSPLPELKSMEDFTQWLELL